MNECEVPAEGGRNTKYDETKPIPGNAKEDICLQQILGNHMLYFVIAEQIPPKADGPRGSVRK